MTAASKRRWLEAMLSALPCPCFVLTRDREIVAVNSEAQTELGLLPGQPQLPAALAGPDFDKTLEPLFRRGQGSTTVSLGASSPRARPARATAIDSGSGHWVLISLAAAGNDGRGVATPEIEALDRHAAIARLLPGLAHELRGPLTTISGVAQVLCLAPEIPDDCRAAVDLVQCQVERADALLRNIVAFARGPREIADFPISVNDAVQRALALLAHDIRSARLDVDEMLASDLPLVSAEPEELLQVILAPLSLALARIAQGRSKVTMRVQTQALPGCGTSVDIALAAEPALIAIAGERNRLRAARAITARLGGNIEANSDGFVVSLPGWNDAAAGLKAPINRRPERAEAQARRRRTGRRDPT